MLNASHNPRRIVRILEGCLLVPLVFAGAYYLGRSIPVLLPDGSARKAVSKPKWTDPAEHALERRMPPGPPRIQGKAEFILDASNSSTMTGFDDPANERWADVAGNIYTNEFIRNFSYEAPPPEGPAMFVQVAPTGKTLRGRLEIRNMKPNFAYQIKLRGRYADDPEGFRGIGYAGRWRLPGGGTNFTDKEFEAVDDKSDATAYILFDYVVTDSHGHAARDFALDSSLHVLWNVDRQRVDPPAKEVTPVVIDASNPEFYARPKDTLEVERIWAEPETVRYKGGRKTITLPPRKYHAEIVLTEESWHAFGNDSGYWATVAAAPVEFTIRE